MRARSPIIGITVDTNSGVNASSGKEASLEFGVVPAYWLKKNYVEAVEKAGGIPLLIPPAKGPAKLRKYIEVIDGLLVSGGDFDIDPACFGEKPIPQCGPLKPDRAEAEFLLIKLAMRAKKPVLGICGGLQTINVVMKGDLYQDLPTQKKNSIRHSQSPVPPDKATHTVSLPEGSLLSKITKRVTLKVNSTHHQAIRKVGKKLNVEALAPDGLVEAVSVSNDDGLWVVGVQWHPEALYDKDEPSRQIFKNFVREASSANTSV